MASEEVKRNATPSAEGWDFQANAAIVLFIRNIKDVDEVRVEGDLEDIEVKLRNGTKIYSQAKMRTTRNAGDGSTRRFRDALKTLADDVEAEDCAQLLYITNDEYPFGTGHKSSMFGDDSLYRYDELPDNIRTYIKKAANRAGISDDSLEMFSICVIGFYGDDDETRYRVIHRYVEKLISDLKLGGFGSIDSRGLRRTWDYMLGKNATKEDTGITVSKAEFIWPIVYMLCEVSSGEKIFDDYDYDFQEEVLAQYRKTIAINSERFSLITKIMSDYNDFVYLHPRMSRRELMDAFISEAWMKYEDEIGVEDIQEDTRKVLVGIIMRKVVAKFDVIKRVKREVNLED